MTLIVETLLNILQFVVNLLMTPIDSFINAYIPSVATGLEYVGNFFNYIIGFIPWIMSWFNLPTLFIELIIAYYVFKLTVPLLVHTFKLIISWWEAIVS